MTAALVRGIREITDFITGSIFRKQGSSVL